MPSTRRFGGALLLEQTAPGTPASGYLEIYAKTDGILYYKNDAGTEVPIGPQSSVIEVEHGATAGTARPTGVGVVMWVGSVRPTNAVDGDLLLYVPTATTTFNNTSLWRRGAGTNNIWSHLGGGQIGQGNVEPDASFETAITGHNWNGYLNCTPAQSADFARTGGFSMKATKNGTPENMYFAKYQSLAYFIPVIEGDAVVASAWSYSPVTARGFQVVISFLTAYTDFGSAQAWSSPATTEIVGQWVYHQSGGIAPAGATYARVIYQWNSVAAAEVHYIDDIRFERGLIPSVPALARQYVGHIGTPTDASVLRGEAQLYLDVTTGNPKVRAKIKDAADTTFAIDLGGTNNTFPEITAPPTPPAGSVVLYAKADGLLYSKDDAGVETVVTGGGGGSVSYPLLAPNGLVSAPSYSFSGDTDSGMYMNAVGDLRVIVGGHAKLLATDDGTNGNGIIDARGTGSTQLRHGGTVRLGIYPANNTTNQPLHFIEQAAPGTPIANEVSTYAKADGKMYSKDDTGVETLMSAGDPDPNEFMAWWGAF